MVIHECGVCGYIHKEEIEPRKCPVCDAPAVMFTHKEEEPESEKKSPAEPQIEATASDDSVAAEENAVDSQASSGSEENGEGKVKTWRCTVSGYLHTGPEPPEKCPICEATREDFEEVVEQKGETVTSGAGADRRWRCKVCGYIHTGEEPPEVCPVCAAPKSDFVEIDAEGKQIGESAAEVAVTQADKVIEEKSFVNTLSKLILKFHLHPITTHFPNGILPAALTFLAIAIFFKVDVMEKAAFFNLVFVLVMLPAVLVTGFVEWQRRYKGLKTTIFIVKICCALIVLASVNVLVFWRIIDPQVAADGQPYQLVYLGVAAAMLGAAGIAGHLGGKLTFAGRNE